MTRSGLVFLLLGALAWAQAAKSGQDAAMQTLAAGKGAIQPEPAGAPKVASDAAVITINGLCDNPAADKTANSGCKIIFTRAQFETLADQVQPNQSPAQRKGLATTYADEVILAKRALEMGLDKGPQFEEVMKLWRLTLLQQLLQQAMQEKAAQISDKDIADYYHQNIGVFQQIQLQRVQVPLSRRLDSPTETLTAAELQKRQLDSFATMKNEADELHARAMAGEDFATLQQEACKVAGIMTIPQSRMETYQRRDLPDSQVSMMDLKSGEISAVIKEANGYFFYKAGERDTVPLEKVRPQITSTLKSQRYQQYMKEARQSASAVLNEEYFTVKPTAQPNGVSTPGATTPGGKGAGAAE